MSLKTLLKNYGFDDKTILKIEKMSIQNKMNIIKTNLKYFENIGFSHLSIITIIKKYYNIINYNLKFIEEKIEYFKKLNFTLKEIELIIVSKPTILAYELSTIISKIDILQKYDFSQEEIKHMIIKMPSLLSFSVNNLEKKLQILSKLNIKKIIVHNPKLTFIQSEILTLVRYKYLLSINYSFNDKNIRYLFADNKKFTTKFKITKEELLKKYK